MKIPDLTGMQFTRWTVIKYSGVGNNGTTYLCRCLCGKEKIVNGKSLRTKMSRSCGCLQSDQTRSRNHPWFKLMGNTRRGMMERCNNPNHKHYKYYGGSGIKVCKEWTESYQKFRAWAFANGYRPGLHIDRIDPTGNYTPSNCRFVTVEESAKNKRNTKFVIYAGQKITRADFMRLAKVSQTCFYGSPGLTDQEVVDIIATCPRDKSGFINKREFNRMKNELLKSK